MSLTLIITKQPTIIYPTIEVTAANAASFAAAFDIVELDASITEEHTSTASVISHPIEDGSLVSDHVSINPDKLVIQGQISNYPPYFGAGIAYSYVRAEKAYDQLREWLYAAKKVDVVTSLRNYTNMVMTSMSVPRDAETGNVLRFTSTFESIKIVKSQVEGEDISAVEVAVIPPKWIGNLVKAQAAAVFGAAASATILAFGIARSIE